MDKVTVKVALSQKDAARVLRVLNSIDWTTLPRKAALAAEDAFDQIDSQLGYSFSYTDSPYKNVKTF
jgi:hypothetical protein